MMIIGFHKDDPFVYVMDHDGQTFPFCNTHTQFHGVDNKQGYMQTERVRDFVNGPGTLIGDMDFMAGKPRRFRAIARTTVEAAYLTRDAYATLAKKNPGVLNVLQAAMLRSIGEQLAYTLDLLYQLDLADG